MDGNSDKKIVKNKKRRQRFVLRLFFTVFLCAFIVTASLSTAVFAESPDYVNQQEWEVLKLTNEQRAQNGELEALTTFQDISAASRLRASEIISVFDHARPDGTLCFTALDSVPYLSLGENIAAGYSTPADVVDGWMNSPGHRQNILTQEYKHIGVGYVKKHWVQMFISGCETTNIAVSGVSDELQLSLNDDIASLGLMLEVKCNDHGVSYMPLENASYACRTNTIGTASLSIEYGGKKRSIPVFVNFVDVRPGNWYYDAVRSVWKEGILEGVSGTEFSPDTDMTRSMFVSALYRMDEALDAEDEDADNDEDASDMPGRTDDKADSFDMPDADDMSHTSDFAEFSDVKFSDVKDGTWYSDAVSWAAGIGIVNGIGADRFGPDEKITRQQAAVMLYRYYRYKDESASSVRRGLGGVIGSSLSSFKDGGSVAGYAVESMAWAVDSGLIGGTDSKAGNLLTPAANASRAQIATILMRFLSIVKN